MRRLCVIVLLVGTIGCGSSTSTPTTPTTVMRIISSGTYNANAHTTRFIPFSVTSSGRLDLVVSWRDATDTVWVQIATSECTNALNVVGQCTYLFDDRATIAVPKKMPSVRSFQAGSYMLLIDNRGPADEAVMYEIDLTS